MNIHNYIYIEDTYYVTLGKNGIFKIRSVDSITSIYNNFKLLTILSSINKSSLTNTQYLQSFKTLLSNMIYNAQFGIIDYLYLKGIGFRVLHNYNILFFKLNYSHYIYYVLPLEMKVNIKKKNKLIKFHFFQDRLAKNMINRLHKFRITNIYTQKGIFKKSQLIFKKEGKKKQI